MNELRNAINEHIVSDKMRDILILMLRRIEYLEEEVNSLYQGEVDKRDIDELKMKIADLLGIPRADL